VEILEKKYNSIAISSKAYDILNKLTAINGMKKYVYVSELIEAEYRKIQEK
jgi:hypothetical protein